MDIYSKYMPPDYLALKISYCREQLEKLPIVRTQVHTISGSTIIMVAVGNHKYHADSPNGINALNILKTKKNPTRAASLIVQTEGFILIQISLSFWINPILTV